MFTDCAQQFFIRMLLHVKKIQGAVICNEAIHIVQIQIPCPDGLRLKSDNLMRCCRLQDRGAVQGRSESRWRDIAHRRGGREARLARGGIALGHIVCSGQT